MQHEKKNCPTINYLQQNIWLEKGFFSSYINTHLIMMWWKVMMSSPFFKTTWFWPRRQFHVLPGRRHQSNSCVFSFDQKDYRLSNKSGEIGRGEIGKSHNITEISPPSVPIISDSCRMWDFFRRNRCLHLTFPKQCFFTTFFSEHCHRGLRFFFCELRQYIFWLQ